MQFVKQKTKIPIRNNDVQKSSTKIVKRHSELLPNNLRCIISGPSGKNDYLL